MKLIKQITNNGLILTVKELKEIGINPGNKVIIDKINSSKEYDVFLKLLGLWELLLKELNNQTGYSSEWWKWELKMRAGYGQVVEGPNNTKRFIPRSMSWDDSTMEQRSKLFSDSFKYIVENEIIDLCIFESRYIEITGRCLI